MIYSPDPFIWVFKAVVQSSARVSQNISLPATVHLKILSAPPSNNLMEKIGTSSLAASLIGLLFNIFYLFIPGPLLNYNSENSNGDSLPGWNNERADSPTCSPPNPLTPPSVITLKLNLPITFPLPDAVCDK